MSDLAALLLFAGVSDFDSLIFGSLVFEELDFPDFCKLADLLGSGATSACLAPVGCASDAVAVLALGADAFSSSLTEENI